MEIVKSDGRLFSGITCLYQLANGNYLFSEKVADEGDAYAFDAEKTCVVQLGAPRENGETPYMLSRLDRNVFAPQRVRIMKSAVVLVQDTTDESLVKTARGVIAGLVLPGGGKGK